MKGIENSRSNGAKNLKKKEAFIQEYSLDGWNIRIARSKEEVEELRPFWEQWQKDPNGDFDFYFCIIESRPEIIRPHVMLLTKNGVPQAMLIGRIERQKISCQLGYITIFNPEVTVLAIVYGGVLGDVSSSEAEIFFRELLACLKRGEADAIRLDFLKRDTDLFRVARMTPGFLQRDRVTASSKHITMDLPSDGGELYRKMSSKRRNKLRRLPRVLEEDNPGKIFIRYFQKEEELEELTTDADEIAKKTYQHRIGVSFNDNEEHRARLRLWARKNCLLGCILYIDKKPCAFWIGLIYGGKWYLWVTGYDPIYKNYEIGTILLVKLIENICENYKNVREVDFSFGDAVYKQRFGTRSWEENTIFVFGNTFRGLGINLIRTIIVMLGGYADRILTHTNLRSKIKRIWRMRILSKRENS